MRVLVIVKASNASEIFEAGDFGAEVTPELQEQERRVRERAEKNA